MGRVHGKEFALGDHFLFDAVLEEVESEGVVIFINPRNGLFGVDVLQ